MRRKLFTLLASVIATVIAMVGFSATSAQAASPHYVSGPSASVSSNSLTVTFKAAGLANLGGTADFTLTGTVTATAQCFTKSGNPVNGVPKTDTTNVNASDSFPIRNGQTTGKFVVSPLTTLKCTGSQVARVLSVSYDLVLFNVYLGSTHLVG